MVSPLKWVFHVSRHMDNKRTPWSRWHDWWSLTKFKSEVRYWNRKALRLAFTVTVTLACHFLRKREDQILKANRVNTAIVSEKPLFNMTSRIWFLIRPKVRLDLEFSLQDIFSTSNPSKNVFKNVQRLIFLFVPRRVREDTPIKLIHMAARTIGCINIPHTSKGFFWYRYQGSTFVADSTHNST